MLVLTVHALISGTLGALILAVAILYRRQKRQEALIRQLSAEVTAQKIAALTGQQQRPAGTPEQPSEPARRRRHLALYIGGGFAAAFTACRKALRRLDPKRTVATVAVTSVAVVGTAAGVYMNATSGETDTQPPAASSSAPTVAQPPRASDDEHVETKNVANEKDTPAEASKADTEVEAAGLNPATAEAPPRHISGENTDPAEVGTEPGPADDETPGSEPPAPTPPPAGDPDPTPPDQPDVPDETEPPTEDEDQDDGTDGANGGDREDGICIGIPKFIELCFGRSGMTGTVLDRPIRLHG